MAHLNDKMPHELMLLPFKATSTSSHPSFKGTIKSLQQSEQKYQEITESTSQSFYLALLSNWK